MGFELKSERIDIGGTRALLVSVSGGSAAIGTASVGYCDIARDTSVLTRMFYIGSSPVAEMLCPDHGSKSRDKMISLCAGYTASDKVIHEKLTDGLCRLNQGEPPEECLRGAFALLSDGVYTVYLSEYHPTDSAGVFFLNAYSLTHEIRGTAENNKITEKKDCYFPCYLIPGVPPAEVDIKGAKGSPSGEKIQGIAYHLAGYHSVLLKGHHNAALCSERGLPFTCAVIEKITEPYTEYTGEETEDDLEDGSVPPREGRGITGFRSPSVKIPLERFPHDMLELLIRTRTEYKPKNLDALIKRLNKG